MKKIGILTINNYSNYGNRLQNYALQEVLKKLDFSVVTVVNQTNYFTLKFRLKRLTEQSPKELIGKISDCFKHKNEEDIHHETNSNREKHFLEFTKDFIRESDYVISEKYLPKEELDSFDYFVTGSDQVWNPSFRYGSFMDFLTFTPSEKRIAYAASFGVNRIPKEHKNNFSTWLTEMAHLSVREEAGANIIRELTGRKVPVLADPTLLLTKEEWLMIAKPAKNRPNKPYILTYFLDWPDKKTKLEVEKLARDKQMATINLGDIFETETYETGPREFIDYINHADAFFTDSFHAVVFSLIFEMPFVVYERLSDGPSMYSRIETILDNFGLRNREAKQFDGDYFSMDYSKTKEILNKEYEKSIDYLRNALRIEG